MIDLELVLVGLGVVAGSTLKVYLYLRPRTRDISDSGFKI